MSELGSGALKAGGAGQQFWHREGGIHRNPDRVFFKFISTWRFVKSRRLWDLINIISSIYLDS